MEKINRYYFGAVLLLLHPLLGLVLARKLIELSYLQLGNNFFSGLLIFWGFQVIATKGLILSVKEIVKLIEVKEINDQNEKVIKRKCKE